MKIKKRNPEIYSAERWHGTQECDGIAFLSLKESSYDIECFSCGKLFLNHGVFTKSFDKKLSMIAICPEDWIIRNSKGLAVFVCKDEFFHEMYEEVK